MSACFFCHEPVDPDGASTWQATSCFTRMQRVRASGKRRDMSDRIVYRYLDSFAHDRCIQRFKNGIAAGQQTIDVA